MGQVTNPMANAPQDFAQDFSNYQSIPMGAQYNPNIVGGNESPYAAIMRRMSTGNYAAPDVSGTGGFNPDIYNTPTTGTETISAPTTPPPRPYIPPPIFTPPNDVDEYDQDNQDAINKIEQEVADEQYDQDNQDAINKIEQDVADEALEESARATDIDDATISVDQPYNNSEFVTASDIDDASISVDQPYNNSEFVTASDIDDASISEGVSDFGDSDMDVGVGDMAGYAKGGMIRGLLGPNPKGPDDGFAMVQRGEYVIKKSAVKKYGRGLLDMINEGKVPAKKIKSLLD
jgi:hypothetical protein